jgi:oligoendopeptidase F
MKYASKWDLECFFQKGSQSGALLEEIERVKTGIESLESLKKPQTFLPLLEKMQDIDASLRQCDAFILCLESQDTADEKANQLRAEFTSLEAKFQLFCNRFDDFLVQMDAPSFNALISDPKLAEIRFVLEERRLRGSEKLSCEKEDLMTKLSVDGYHGWGDLYPMLVKEIKIPFTENGKTETLSFGQAENKLAHPNRKVRKEVFESLEKAWESKASLFSSVLNHIAGYRLEVYALRGWSDPLHEPLFENRMSQETLNAMWSAVEQYKKPLVAFMQAKAKLLNIPALSWYDLETPLSEAAGESISYDQGAEQIIEHFEQFHPRMGAFAEKACKEKWIEAEDRPGKRPGGYCVSFPKSRQSRIFMTYSGTMVNVSTLAHELGHAYHTEMIDDLQSFAQHYRMNVAETASTFAEQIISDALLSQAKTRERKLEILSGRIERSVAFMMNIHARFLFETQFYNTRKEKFLSAEELCQMMQKAQEKAYCGALSEYHPYFWAAKLHFYFTGVPFYNFPYTFGYLFSLGIYNRAKKEGASFGRSYDNLLRESGMMSTEDLAKKHLGVDLRKPDFWKESCAAAVADVDEFLKLV